MTSSATQAVSRRDDAFTFEGHRLAFTEYGAGDRVVVLLHGLFLSREMYERFALRTAADGYRVVALDLLGHGDSDRVADREAYSVTDAARAVLGLLDHLGVSSAAVGGLSLGANIALAVAVEAPDRVRGLLLEMPSVEDGLNFIVLAMPPMMQAARRVPWAFHGLRRLGALPPRAHVPFWGRVLLSYLDQDPRALDATLQGVLFGGLAPTAHLRRGVDVPALVIGHPGDPLHPISDARRLAEELPQGRFIRAANLLEWRLAPSRLDGISADFLASLWPDGSV